MSTTTGECRHEWQCDGWTIDPINSTCRVCGHSFVFWSERSSPTEWKIEGEAEDGDE